MNNKKKTYGDDELRDDDDPVLEMGLAIAGDVRSSRRTIKTEVEE